MSLAERALVKPGQAQISEIPRMDISENGNGTIPVFVSGSEIQTISERELVDRAKTGDQEATAQLYEIYWPRVYRYVLARTGQVEESEDLAQDVFLRAIGAIDRFQWREAPFSAWLFRIAHNDVISTRRRDSVRKNVYLSKVVLESRYGVIVTVADVLEDQTAPDIAQRLDLIEACQHLTGAGREVIGLRFAAGLSVAETAVAMGKNENNVKVIQHKAIVKLRKLLGVGNNPRVQAA